jgi:hypothetical protein
LGLTGSAIQTAVLGATPACQFDLMAKSFPCAMYSDCRIFGGDFGLLGQFAEFAVLQIHDPERIVVDASGVILVEGELCATMRHFIGKKGRRR